MGREDSTMNEQEREEVAELILRACRLQYELGVAHAEGAIWVYDLIALADKAHAAQRECWEALYRIRIDSGSQSQQRTVSADPHDAKPVV
jgi:hypothetical protein